MRAPLARVAVAALLLGTCGGAVVPRPTPTASSSAPVDRVQIYYARSDAEPLAVALDLAAGMPVEQRVYARFAALAAAPWLGPAVSFNVLTDAARVSAVSVDRDLGVLDLAVAEDEWTATDERSIHKVRLTQNGGQDAVIATADAIVTYNAPLTREIVAPNARPDHSVAYFARDQDEPLAVFLPGIVRVLITQNGERGAVIGGEGLIIDRPQTRRGLLGS